MRCVKVVDPWTIKVCAPAMEHGKTKSGNVTVKIAIRLSTFVRSLRSFYWSAGIVGTHPFQLPESGAAESGGWCPK
jgi:hypothetical protein